MAAVEGWSKSSQLLLKYVLSESQVWHGPVWPHCQTSPSPLPNLHVTAVETPTQPDVIKNPTHKRYDRVFLIYPKNSTKETHEDIRQVRKYLRCVSCEILRKPVTVEMSPIERDHMDVMLLNVCPQDSGCKEMVDMFLHDDNLPAAVRYNLARVFYILSGDAAVSAFVPVQFHDHLMFVCDALDRGTHDHIAGAVDEMYEYCPELADLVRSTKGTEYTDSVLSFIRYLVNFVNNVFAADVSSDPAVPVPGTYDPESGIAYYFTNHGCRMRDVPTYSLDQTRHAQDLFDDAPVQDDCNKLQAKVSPGGFNYTFYWFCPIHGHCLGFHLMPGAEGRKDPFSSMYAYLPNAPEEVFYDFACSLNEYSLNREPHHFKNTRFWHDLFHGFSHKCPPSLQSSRIRSLSVLDTEICEQFNAFLQNIKYTGSHLIQNHFCLYLQFMIHIWNSRKDRRWTNIAAVAAAAAVNRADD